MSPATSIRCLVLLCLMCGVSAIAQNAPHVGYVYPAGGQKGTNFVVTIGGRYLNAMSVRFTGSGISATVLEQERQLTPAQQAEFKETLGKFQAKRKAGEPITTQEMQTAMEIKQKLERFGRRPANPTLGEVLTVRVTIASTATPGDRELRVVTPAGLSNPLIFNVGELPEITKEPWISSARTKRNKEPIIEPAPPPAQVTLPVTVNGQVPPGGVDHYRFAAQAGQQLVVAVRARELIPYISDAVPGWLQAVVRLCDADGREIACADDLRFRPDPVLFYRIPTNGDYVLEIHDSLYRGREDFVYRITMGELPYVTSVFPLGGQVGQQTNLTTSGWNLPVDQIPLDLRGKAPGVYPLFKKPGVNRVLAAADTLPEIPEQEPNNTIEHAQPVILPVIINGRIDQPGDLDLFCFEGNAGDKIVAEIYARRLDSPLDSFLILTDAAGQQLAFNDDHEDPGSGLNTHHADSYLAFTLPHQGRYFVHLGDTQHGGGSAYAYRLRLSAPRPDFELRATPSAVNVRGSASGPVTVHVLRRDGFTGPIRLNLVNAPSGFTLAGAEVPENQDKVTFTLNAPPSQRSTSFFLRIEGRAKINGHEVVRQAVPADDVMQAFAYRHLVPAQEFIGSVVGPFRPARNAVATAQILTPTPVRIATNGTARIAVQLPVGPRFAQVEYELSDAPDGIRIKESSPSAILIEADPAKVKPGLRGNLIVEASAEPPAKQAAAKNRRRVPLGTLPAIPFEVLSR